MLALCAALSVLAAEPAAAPQKPPLKLASPGLKGVGLTPEQSGFWGDQLAQELTLAGVRVTTPAELATLLGVERQKQLLGCSDEGSSCMTELTGALGVDGIVTGTVAKVGTGLQMNVKVLDAITGNALSAASTSADGEKELVAELRRLSRAIANELFQKLDRSPVFSAASKALEGGRARRLFWLPAVFAALAVGTGVGLLVDADGKYRALTMPNPPVLDAFSTANAGKNEEILGIALFGLGGVALVASAMMYAFGGPKDPELYVAPAPSPGGATLGFGGTW